MNKKIILLSFLLTIMIAFAGCKNISKSEEEPATITRVVEVSTESTENIPIEEIKEPEYKIITIPAK